MPEPGGAGRSWAPAAGGFRTHTCKPRFGAPAARTWARVPRACELAAGAERPADVLPAIRTALRLPFAELRGDGQVIGRDGVEVQDIETVPLVHPGQPLGELRLGVRRGESRLDPRDLAILELLAVPMAMALRATVLSDAVQRASARESTERLDERRRLRQDVHDGMGPLLTGIAFQTDAAAISPRGTQRAPGSCSRTFVPRSPTPSMKSVRC